MKILVVDNFDSFTYNLVHLVSSVTGSVPSVIRNDNLENLDLPSFSHILLSPGPGLPSEAGGMPQLIKKYSATHSILGICLGHQAIAESFGAKLKNLDMPLHGVATKINIIRTEDKLFKNIDTDFSAAHYHSWVADPIDFPESLEITAEDPFKNIMAFRHVKYDVCGLQFHPESILTPDGKTIIRNWLEL